MPAHVQSEVVGPGEGAATQRAGEWTMAGVLPSVPRQLVGPGEAPGASRPAA